MSEGYEQVTFVADEWSGERLDKALAQRFDDLSRAQIQALIREERVKVNGKVVKASYRLEGGETISLELPVTQDEPVPQPEAIEIEVVYEDDHVAVVNKPAGMVVHPAFGHVSGTLVNAVLARWPQTAELNEIDRAGIVHRLDKDTSGVIVIAKTREAVRSLRAQFKARTVQKRYLALVEGVPSTGEGVIDAPIGRDEAHRKRMMVTRDGREAVSEFRVIETYADHALVEVVPKTGRTHQIRVHMAFIGHPVVGDTVYGRRKQRIKMKRYFLHAASITFESPGRPEPVTAGAPLPVGLQAVLDKLPR